MAVRSELRAASVLLLLLGAAAGCRSAAAPTFAARGRVPPTGIAARDGGSPDATATALPAHPVRINGPETIVEPATGEKQPSSESPFAKLLGTFNRPRRIPLPRTDLADGQRTAVDGEADEPPATDLAEAF